MKKLSGARFLLLFEFGIIRSSEPVCSDFFLLTHFRSRPDGI